MVRGDAGVRFEAAGAVAGLEGLFPAARTLAARCADFYTDRGLDGRR